MDTINHGVWGYAIIKIIESKLGFQSYYAELFFIIMGMFPDIVGELERLIKKNNSLWNWYSYAHNNWKILRVIPSYGMHILQDSIGHDTNKRWWILKERLWVEILSWIMVIVILLTNNLLIFLIYIIHLFLLNLYDKNKKTINLIKI